MSAGQEEKRSLRFLFDFSGGGAAISVRGKYTLDELNQAGCTEFRAEPTGRWIESRNGRRKMETRGVEYITTKAGRFEMSEWHGLLEEAVFCEEQTWLLNIIIKHVRDHCAWLHTEKEIRNYALECLSSDAYKHWKDFKTGGRQ